MKARLCPLVLTCLLASALHAMAANDPAPAATQPSDKPAAPAPASTTDSANAPDEPHPRMKDVIRAHVAAEQTKEKAGVGKPALPAPPPITPTGKAEDKNADVLPAAPAADKNAAVKDAPSNTPKSAAKEPATVMPKVEVRRERITKLDVEIAKQEHEIELEKQNTKSSELDKALNDSKVARPLAIFGGESTQFREGVAKERVQLMQAEKDILEAMKLAKTKAERDDLQKQLEEIRAYRRELEKTMR